MLSILNTSPYGRVEVNTLFIQPTRWCALNCKGCYVKEHQGGEKGYHTPMKEQVELFRKFYDGEKAYANQITISADNLPELNPYDDHRDHMGMFLHDVIAHIRYTNTSTSPEVHATFNSESVFKDYASYIGCTIHALAAHFNMVSFSNISDLDFIKKLTPKTHVNYNHLIPSNVTSFNIDKHVEKMIQIGEVVDSIYFVIFKSPVGGARTELVQVGDTSRMLSDVQYIETMVAHLPTHVRNKIHVDGCLQDTIKSTRTGTGCSSNVSRFQVWPDGSVSGCAYAFEGTTAIGRRADDILENIREARKTYDFKTKCHLPAVYNSVQERLKNI